MKCSALSMVMIWLGCAVFGVACWAGAIYVALHFIAKW
jgi:hypothetical protein